MNDVGGKIAEVLPYRAATENDSGSPFFVSDGEASLGGLESPMSPLQTEHLMSASQMQKCVEKLGSAMLKRLSGEQNLIFVGIRSRGVPLANRLAEFWEKKAGTKVAVGALDINLYRDDLSEVDDFPIVKCTELPSSITGRGVVLIDDVLYTGRTIRAALDALMDFGRPRFIQLSVLVDRGFRELPIESNYVGTTIESQKNENIKVLLESVDGEDGIVIERP